MKVYALCPFILMFLFLSCNSEPPRRPGVNKKGDNQNLAATSGNGAKGCVQGSESPECTQQTQQPPQTQPPQTQPPQPVETASPQIKMTVHFRPKVNEANREQGGWHKVCLSVMHGDGHVLPEVDGLCNKFRKSSGCWMYQEENQGKTIEIDPASLTDGKLNLEYEIFMPAQRCQAGSVEEGFRYRDSANTELEPVTVAGSQDPEERLRCGRKVNPTGGMVYKICLEDGLSTLLAEDPQNRDYNDFVISIESPIELDFEGIVCEENDPMFVLPNDRCTSSL